MSWHVAQTGGSPVTTTTLPPTFTPVTEPGACPEDYVDWSELGSPGTLVDNDNVWFTSLYGNIYHVSNAGSVNLVVRKEKPCSGGDFDGNFDACDSLIATNLSGTPAGEIDVLFLDPVGGAAAQVQPVATGAFTAKFRAYDDGDNLLYTGTASGNNTGAGSPGDNTAPWLGVTASDYVIKRVKYSLDSAGGGDTLQLAVNKLFVCPVPTTTTTTLPPTAWPPTLSCPSLSMDYIDWKDDALYGGPEDSLISPFVATGAVSYTPVTISRPGMTLFLRFRESPCPGNNANGSFAPCDEGIFATNIGSPSVSYVAFQFLNGVSAFGTRVQSDAFGQFTARMKVYGSGVDNLLAEITTAGSNNGCVTPGDDTAPFLGTRSDSDNIYRVEISLDQAANDTEKFFSLTGTYFCAPFNPVYHITNALTCNADYLDWSTKGSAGTTLANSFSVTSSVNSVVATVSNAGTAGFTVHKEKPCTGGDLDNIFPACDWVLEADQDSEEGCNIRIDFGQDVGGVVTRVSWNKVHSFGMVIQAYDSDDNFLGEYNVGGNNDGGPGTDTAPYLGIGAWNNNIRYVTISATSAVFPPPNTVMIDRVYFCTTAATTTTTVAPTTTLEPPATEYFSDPSGCTTDYVDWSVLGSPGATPGSPNHADSNGGTTVWFDNPGSGTWLVRKQGSCSGSDFTGDFTPCDFLLKTVPGSPSSEGWIEVAFPTPVRGVITQIQAKDSGAFTARVRAYNEYGVELGTATVNGTSGTAADGSAPQLGIRTVTGDSAIRWVRYSLDSAGSGNLQEFYVNRLKFCTGAPS